MTTTRAAAAVCSGLHVTWGSPRGGTITACERHESVAKALHWWPRDESGDEYCQVHRGGERRPGAVCDLADELAERAAEARS